MMVCKIALCCAFCCVMHDVSTPGLLKQEYFADWTARLLDILVLMSGKVAQCTMSQWLFSTAKQHEDGVGDMWISDAIHFLF